MEYSLKCAYYFSKLNSIGGVESHLYYLAKKYQDRDWAVLCRTADKSQLEKLRKYVRVIQVKPNDRFIVETLFVAYERSILSQCNAEKVYFVIHADYQAIIDSHKLPLTNGVDPAVNEYISVSKVAQKGHQSDSKVVYMPVELDPIEEPIRLVSATRLTAEKGYERMNLLAKALDQANVNYLWDIYTNKPRKIESENVRYFAPRLDITDKFGCYDALVQLSDSEAFCLSNQEALLRGIPLITTPLPVNAELGIDERYSVTVPFDMESIPVEEIRHIKAMKKNMPKYNPPKDGWDALLPKGGKYNQEKTKVRALKTYQEYRMYDSQLKKIPNEGEEFYVSKERLHVLLGNNSRGIVYVEIIE